jgi:DNA-binding response OmpR family regulator/transcriptional regulator with XRE-family HTH domain
MVIDDEALIRQLLTYQLGAAGYEISSVPGGREALTRLVHERPDLILLDVMMPDMSGWDVCRQIRTFSTVPIIMLTSKAADEDVVTGLMAGADDYVSKPYSLNQLLARVEAVLRRARNLNPSAVKSGGGIDQTSDPRQRPKSAYEAQAGLETSLPRPSVAVEPEPAQPAARIGLGQRLAEARKMRGMSLYQAEMACGIRWEFLQALEYEHFNYIPRAQLRQNLRRYSMYLGVDLRDFATRQPTANPPAKSPAKPMRWQLPLALVATLMLVIALVVSLT